MLKSYILVFLVICLTVSYPDEYSKDHLDIFSDPQLLKALTNYEACKKWQGFSCLECSDGYYFDKHGLCVQVDPSCKYFNKKEGICDKCYDGYHLKLGKCQQVDLLSEGNYGCKRWDEGDCVECAPRFFKNYGKCQKIDDLCREWDESGNCKLCYKGYIVEERKCIRDPYEFAPSEDSLCAEWKDRVCLRCAERAYFNDYDKCVAVSDYCKTWDLFDGQCLSCYNGYDLKNGACVQSEPSFPIQGCKIWDEKKEYCVQCAYRWVKTSKGCYQVDDQCRDYDIDGKCTKCYEGYDLNYGKCEWSKLNDQEPTDLGCKTWDWKNQICLECSHRWVKKSGKCQPVDDNCAKYDDDGYCLECYKGYEKNGNYGCVLSKDSGPQDLGCKTWDWDNQICLECSHRWVMTKSGCKQVDDHCAEYDDYGYCVKCYKGYEKDGKYGCVLSKDSGPQDLGCKTWDWDNQICLQCSHRWVMTDYGCKQVSDQCADYDLDGHCKECYKGYKLDKKWGCIEDKVLSPSDLGCKTWDWENQICLQCSHRWVMTEYGCKQVDDYCAEYDKNGYCTQCYKGYELDGKWGCTESDNSQGPGDLGCRTWDWDNQICLECSHRWVMTSYGCKPVSDHCAEYDETGACTKCYKGYVIIESKGKCQESDIDQPTDLGCGKWDWDNQICLQCSHYWHMTAQGCVPNDDYCKIHNSDGSCEQCYLGYFLYGDKCELSDPLCKTVDSHGSCATCYTGYVLFKNKCTEIAELAKHARKYSEEKYLQLRSERNSY